MVPKMSSDQEEEDSNFVPREYQVEIFEEAQKSNIIVFMPTGSGKTFIAAMLIKHKSKDVEKSFTEGGKRTFFLVNTVALVTQQAKSLSRQIPLTISTFSGDMGVDYWDKNTWHEKLDESQVLVMTAQIFLNMLLHDYIKLRDVNLVIFDECHHAVSKAPMRQIMELFEKIPSEERPHVMGLTATLLNSNAKAERVEQEIHGLEVTFQAKVIKPDNEEVVKKYATKPKEEIIYYDLDVDVKGYIILENLLNPVFELMKSLVIDVDKPTPTVVLPNAELFGGSKPFTVKLKNILQDILECANDLGTFGATKAALVRLISFERLKLSCTDKAVSKFLGHVVTLLNVARKELDLLLGSYPAGEQPLHFSTNRLKKLLTLLKNVEPHNLVIVFVERRITAQVLFSILKYLHVHNPDFQHIRPDFIVGYNSNPFNDTRESLFARKKNNETLHKFNTKQTNLLFASDVLEEGIDIQLCNYVIKFDLPKTFRSYIQSKGRARHPDSRYILLSPRDAKFNQSYEQYKDVESVLKKILTQKRIGGSEEEAKEQLYLKDSEIFSVKKDGGAKVTVHSAVSLLNRFCNTLPNDRFSKLTPFWWVQKDNDNGSCTATLQLPINCSIKELIVGPACSDRQCAKRCVALKACQLLHEAGDLDANLLPIGTNTELLTDPLIFPLWDSSDGRDSKFKPGSKKSKRIYTKNEPGWMSGCSPNEGEEMYLHLISMCPNYPLPDTSRQRAFFQLIKSKHNFAILTSKKWPKICEFSIYMNIGEIKVKLNENVKKMELSKENIKKLFDFHCLLFTDALSLVSSKKFLVKDYENAENSYYIVPVIQDGAVDNIKIDWDVVEKHKSIPEAKPIPYERRGDLVVTKEKYVGKIVIPWYRPEGYDMKYVVTKVCSDETPRSPFPSDAFHSYEQYFDHRYGQKIRNPDQPLLEVRAISSKINCILPRGKRNGSSRKRGKDVDDYEEVLIPELCCLLTFPAVYMLKVTVLPTIMHRIKYLFLAEQLRLKIAFGTGLGKTKFAKDFTWEPIKFDSSSLQDDENETSVKSTIEISNMLSNEMEALNPSGFPWDKSEEPLDIERDIDSVDLLTLMHYDKFINNNNGVKTEGNKMSYVFPDPVNNPAHLSLKVQVTDPSGNNSGPQLSEVFQVLVSASANDVVNYERLETLGDSFLKFAVSLALFVYFQNKDEGKLTVVKGKIIGNRNLFYCGRNIGLGSMLKVNPFAAGDWEIPGYCLIRSVRDIMREAKIPPGILYQINFSKDERETGLLRDSTMCQLHEQLSNALEADENTQTSLSIIGQQSVPDKVVADSVEALIGVYIKGCGVEGAFRLCSWLGILPEYINDVERLLYSPPPTARLTSRSSNDVDSLLIMPNLIERKLGYTFKDRSFLLQALTHSSYFHTLTDCYQRLEFLGDAILDFLITVHIFFTCGDLTPGELTDLRSALVNNVTFACLTVRYGFHTHILAKACKQNELICHFVEHQEARKHAIGAEVLFLVEEDKVKLAESIDVPKILGDIFESLVAAVYLDSNKNLETVWQVIYRLMHNEITEFSKNVPKNHLRLLYEKFPSPLPKFGSTVPLSDDRGVMVPLQIVHNGELKIFHGFGERKSQAKLAAAQIALKSFHSLT